MEKSISRWHVLIGGIICQFCAGIFYSWSTYVKPLIEKFGWAKNDVQWTFSIAAMLIPIFMIFASKVMAKKGPTFTALIGAVSLTLGLVISGFAKSLGLLYLGYGIFGGIGVGFIYGVPIGTCAKWFPDKKGLITGLAVAGFGLGSVIFGPIAPNLIKSLGVNETFFVQAAITAVGVAIGAPMMKTAPDGYKPAGWEPPKVAGKTVAVRDYTSSEMLRTKEYWFLLVMYLFANIAGLFAISNASPIAQDPGLANLTATQAGAIVSLLSIFNTLGRFISGAASDKLGAKRVVTNIYILDLILFLLIGYMKSYVLFAIGIAGIAICFGAMMGVYPSLVMGYFGTKYSSSNYAYVFLAYGFGSLIATGITAIVSSYSTVFIIIAAACAIGVVMSLISKTPVHHEDSMDVK